MGIAIFTAKLLGESFQHIEKKDRLLQLGTQAIMFPFNDLKFHTGYECNKSTEFQDVNFFKSFGVDEVHACDYSDYEGSKFKVDLNLPIAQSSLKDHLGYYDIIFDGGTLEHIFDVPAALRNLHSLLADGGYVIHNVGAHNFVDHGFYSFSPTFFYDFYEANGYEIVLSYFYEFDPLNQRKCLIYKYSPGMLDSPGMGAWRGMPIANWFVARKLKGATCTSIPQQGAYLREWKQALEMGSGTVSGVQKKRQVMANIIQFSKIVRVHKILREVKYKFMFIKRLIFHSRPTVYKVFK